MGANRTVSVSQSFASQYDVCDNRWHSVKANYVENALTLKVDNLDEQYGFSNDGFSAATKRGGPLFIGGLPGTLCERNMKRNMFNKIVQIRFCLFLV